LPITRWLPISVVSAGAEAPERAAEGRSGETYLVLHLQHPLVLSHLRELFALVAVAKTTGITVVPATRNPLSQGFWKTHPELRTAEPLARIQATDQRFDGAGLLGFTPSDDIRLELTDPARTKTVPLSLDDLLGLHEQLGQFGNLGLHDLG
jgi:hypothetical protein